ncbi:MAG: OmpA family protein [Planctomycetaceae bacterium]|nr:OmpA family protein [Planctomycetaceae bacterium]
MSGHAPDVPHEEEEEEEVAPFWMISFSDMMTLLLTFFIMLYSISTLNQERAAEISNSMQRQFGFATEMFSPFPGSKFEIGEEGFRKKPDTDASKQRQLDIRPVQEMVSRGVILFEHASVELSSDNKRKIADIFPKLDGIPQKIELRGRAALDEEGKGFYSDLMDLAYSRAHNVRAYLIELGIKPDRIEIKSLGAYNPLSKSDDQRGGGINSSVEICVMADNAF